MNRAAQKGDPARKVWPGLEMRSAGKGETRVIRQPSPPFM